MAVYRGKYILEGLGSISPEMEHNLDVAYDICMSYKGSFPCELCGRCCHQPHIIVRPDEIDRVSTAAGIPIYEFMRDYLVQTSDGRFLFKKTNPCAFLGKDKKCRIWKDRPQICDDFPYAVSMFMSRVYLALTNPDADINDLISYMDSTWPCTKVIQSDIAERVEAARKDIVPQRGRDRQRYQRPR
ncbi:MAG: YkgJ family cysteine cluster protein [Thermoplasmata archaeon]|nr:YkgJ family cysteine cluster protein [Thermoplasmata archaeon]